MDQKKWGQTIRASRLVPVHCQNHGSTVEWPTCIKYHTYSTEFRRYYTHVPLPDNLPLFAGPPALLCSFLVREIALFSSRAWKLPLRAEHQHLFHQNADSRAVTELLRGVLCPMSCPPTRRSHRDLCNKQVAKGRVTWTPQRLFIVPLRSLCHFPCVSGL